MGEALEVQVSAGLLIQAIPTYGGRSSSVAETDTTVSRDAADLVPEADPADFIAQLRDYIASGAFTRLLQDRPTARLDEMLDGLLTPWGCTYQIVTRTPVKFFCPCSRQRARNTLLMLDEEELRDIISKEKVAEMTCDFCRTRYTFDEAELEQLAELRRQQTSVPSAASSVCQRNCWPATLGRANPEQHLRPFGKGP